MRQFDIYANPSAASAEFAPFVAILQSHHLREIRTVVVAPLVTDAQPALTPLDVPVEVDGTTLTVAIAEMGVVERGALRRRKGDLLAYEYEIRRALDRLFTGF